MDDRYQKCGYSTVLDERSYGAFLTIKRNGVIVGEVGIGVFEGGTTASVSIIVKRFGSRAPKVAIVDEPYEI